MKWDDYQPESPKVSRYEWTNIECPKCGKHIIRRIDMVLTSYPAQYSYRCPSCNWQGVK